MSRAFYSTCIKKAKIKTRAEVTVCRIIKAPLKCLVQACIGLTFLVITPKVLGYSKGMLFKVFKP